MTKRFFDQTLFGVIVSYRTVILLLRLVELHLIAVRFLFFRAPLLIIWTRLPGLRDRGAPYEHLAEILRPKKGRRPLLVHQNRDVTLGDIKTKEELVRYVQQLRRETSEPRPTLEQIAGGLLRGLLVEFGPVWVKLGVILSMSSSAPEFVREELRSLHDDLPCLSEKVIRKRLEMEVNEFALPFEDIFEWVDLKNPIASGCLAQVHRAKLRSGEMVALKIQRPDVIPLVHMDTMLIKNILMPRVWNLFHGLRKWEPQKFAGSFYTTSMLELNFQLEASYQQDLEGRCRQDRFYSQSVKIPKVYSHLCTKKMLVQELVEAFHPIDGIFKMEEDKLWDLLSTKFDEYPQDYRVHLFRTMCSLWGDMILNWGVVNADPHMGNIYFLEPQDGYGWRVFVCDFGLYFEAAEHMKQWLIEWFRAVMWLRSAEEFLRVSLKYIEPYTILREVDPDFPRIVRARFSAKVEDRMLDFYFDTESEPHATEPKEFLRKKWIQREGDEKVPFVMPVRHPAGRTSAVEAMEMMQKFSVGFHAESMLTEGHWIIFKSIKYIEASSSALFKDASWNDIFMHALRQRMKEEIRYDLERKNYDNIREYIDEVQDMLQRPKTVWKIGRPEVP